MQPDGYVKIKDRSKDIIISGGENISSLEVEDALYRHPAVLAAAVVAQPDPKWGETPCAFVELKPGATRDRGRDHRALPRAPGALQGAQARGLRRAAEDLDRQDPEVPAARAGEVGVRDRVMPSTPLDPPFVRTNLFGGVGEVRVWNLLHGSAEPFTAVLSLRALAGWERRPARAAGIPRNRDRHRWRGEARVDGVAHRLGSFSAVHLPLGAVLEIVNRSQVEPLRYLDSGKDTLWLSDLELRREAVTYQISSEDPMNRTHACQSCGAPSTSTPYCLGCVDEKTGKLQPFEQRFERLLAMLSRHQRKAPREQLVRSTLAYMAAMPAWQDHPRIKAEFPDPQPR